MITTAHLKLSAQVSKKHSKKFKTEEDLCTKTNIPPGKALSSTETIPIFSYFSAKTYTYFHGEIGNISICEYPFLSIVMDQAIVRGSR